MQLINKVSKRSNRPYIYELNHGDSLIIHNEDTNIYIILEGIMLLQKQFTNDEILTTHILNSGNIINTEFKQSSKKNYFYKIEAISKTYISSLSHNYKNIFFEKVFYYKNKDDLYKSQNITEILIHKNVKHRFIHLIILLGELFGTSDYQKIIIQLQISHSMLASIIGTNTNTISKMIRYLEKLNIISYSRKQIIIYNLPLLGSNR